RLTEIGNETPRPRNLLNYLPVTAFLMPKRKRSHTNNEGCQEIDDKFWRRQKVNDSLCRAKKHFHRVLKTARNFERQKLGKRLKRAETEELKTRISTEIKVLKSLDLDKVVNTHLCNTLLKVKSFTKSGLLPDGFTKVENREIRDDPAEETALNNVVSGMLNVKIVRDTIEQIIKETYLAMGIPGFVETKHKNNVTAKQNKDVQITKDSESNVPDNEFIYDSAKSSEYENFGKNYSSYQAYVGNSSDEESFDDIAYKSKSIMEPHGHIPRSLSASPSNISSSSESLSLKIKSQSVDIKSNSTKKLKSLKSTNPGLSSTFLPTLMGGYWSGSEESASDLENFTPTSKKNRPGQMARRAIAEKKYGKMANHIRLGKNSRSLPPDKQKAGRDSNWDPRRGAITDSTTGMSHGRNQGQYTKNPNLRDKLYPKQLPRENKLAINSYLAKNSELQSKAKGINIREVGKSKRDDLGVLHPSWQAAKKAKELKQTAKFQGKKIVF
ncbi:hypothetical protein EPUL_003292, partial [Erysiphe pulchra]